MSKSKIPQTPEQGIKAQEQQLTDSQLKAQFFEAVVNVLETDYGVRLKKSTKRSYQAKSDKDLNGYQGLCFYWYHTSSLL